jgi:hypothetical protein
LHLLPAGVSFGHDCFARPKRPLEARGRGKMVQTSKIGGPVKTRSASKFPAFTLYHPFVWRPG